uniref:60S ribosomal protein L41 n=1 Tax=Macrostomum lignano TaxID=282301 RepID=A0A1I8HXD4_9PLAT
MKSSRQHWLRRVKNLSKRRKRIQRPQSQKM